MKFQATRDSIGITEGRIYDGQIITVKPQIHVEDIKTGNNAHEYIAIVVFNDLGAWRHYDCRKFKPVID